MSSTSFQLSSKQQELLLHLGELILGVPKEELATTEFLREAELFVQNLDDFLISDLNRLLNLFNFRITSFFISLRFRKFTSMSQERKIAYFEKWVYSKLGLLRTGAATLRALCGWSYYSLDAEWDKMDYPGLTIGREHETPTLLEGKQPWSELKEDEN